MIRIVAWAVCIGLASVAHAQHIHKCLTSTGVTYQNAPCSDGQTEAAMKMNDSADRAERVATRAPDISAERPDVPRQTSRWLPFRRTAIALGITDDEVLNMPNWGRPSKIIRTRENRVWREEWFYARADGTRRLSFTNGTLTNIETDADADGSAQLASLARK